MDNFNGYGAFGSYTFPNYSGNFGRQYGNMQNMVTPYNTQAPNFQQQGQQQFNIQQGMQQQPMNPQPNGNYFYVNGVEGAKAFLVPANSSAMLFDSDSKQFFIKSSNAQGQSTIQTFDYAIKEPQTAQNQAKPNNEINYITRDELPKIKANIVAEIKEQFFTKKPNVEVKKDVQ